ncbi:M23 family metallopeptidase [Paenibacillus cymbidii]|uniref:M23 family metallopeptidase n=1 Tax=Paenibacillus cymbidii TaxID=1639034 RepID=UPI001081B3DA|nr:M23 family metallopeptidase [Paenibacillus cymbidii]
MNPRKERTGKGGSSWTPRKFGLLLAGLIVLSAGLTILIREQRRAEAPAAAQTAAPTPSPTATPIPAPTPRAATEFRMADFDRGWVRFPDGAMLTEDGGVSWQEAPAGWSPEAAAASGSGASAGANASGNATGAGASANGTGGAGMGTSGSPAASGNAEAAAPSPATLTYAGKLYAVKQAQFLTARIGWALPTERGAEWPNALLVTADGGQTWQAEVNEAVREAVKQEKERLQREQTEAAYYGTPQLAEKAMRAKWQLIPETTAPGDLVLVRSEGPGDISWQGKTYTLQPFAAGYFTYLPIPMGVKAGKYPIGDQTLTVQTKKFETQYLQVTEQMEAMKQDTARIAADQAKIDAARSKSAPEFLFTQPFVKPIDGILTTPYGYTRYVNGKYDSSHMALDLAAKEGTPIQATNDGVVALADTLYLTGNSIYLDHGMGLFSQYAHMSKLLVKTGDKVKRGDIIGLVGTTGFSTGPHLHFTFWAHNVQANPDLFFGTTPFRWLK